MTICYQILSPNFQETTMKIKKISVNRLLQGVSLFILKCPDTPVMEDGMIVIFVRKTLNLSWESLILQFYRSNTVQMNFPILILKW